MAFRGVGGVGGVGSEKRVSLSQTGLIYTTSAILYSMRCNSAEQTTGVHMYTVSITWGNKAVTHTAWTLASAKTWMAAYPKQDVFGKVTDLFGRRVAVRYYR